jgi:hypothetical protein
MLVYKKWLARRKRTKRNSNIIQTAEWRREGWFLFGFIPLYIRDIGQRGDWQ